MSNTNLKNRTIYCHDNLEVLRGINEIGIDVSIADYGLVKGRQQEEVAARRICYNFLKNWKLCPHLI